MKKLRWPYRQKMPPKIGRCEWCGHWGRLHKRWCDRWDGKRISPCERKWRAWLWEENRPVRPLLPTKQWINLEIGRCVGTFPFMYPYLGLSRANYGRMKKRLIHD